MAARPSQAPTERTRVEWARRVEAEYRSAAVTQHVTLWLIQIGASPDLIRDGLRIVDDELVHAELSHEVVVACAGPSFTLAREGLGLSATAGEPLEADVLRVAVNVYCLGETVAVPLFRALRERCTIPVARRALDRVLRDEVRHREFGWTLLDWLLDGPERDARRQQVTRELPAMFETLRRHYAPPIKSKPCTAAERAWGLMPSASYRHELLRTLERDYIPRFQRRAIDAQNAWNEKLTKKLK